MQESEALKQEHAAEYDTISRSMDDGVFHAYGQDQSDRPERRTRQRHALRQRWVRF